MADKTKSWLGDVKAACGIYEAVSVLDDWLRPNSKVSARETKAFDKLFAGAAHYFEKLPPPAYSYASVLAEIVNTGLLSKMLGSMDPGYPMTSEGQAFQEQKRYQTAVMKALRKPFRDGEEVPVP